MEQSNSTEFASKLKATQDSMIQEIELLKDSNQAIRQELIEFLPILKDFKGLLQRKPLFERSTFVYLSPLAKEIKADIMREVTSKIIGPTEEIRSLKQEIKSALVEVEEKTGGFSDSITNLSDFIKELQKHNEILNENIDLMQKNLDDAREDLLLKAPYYEITRLVEKLASKATIEDLQNIKELISNCPTSDQVEKLFLDLGILHQQMASFASQDMVKEIEVGLISNVDTKFEQYINIKTLNDEIDRVVSLIRETNEAIEFFKNRQEKISTSHKREVEKIQKLLQTRPWTKDIELLSTFIDDKANKKDLEKFKGEVVPQVKYLDEKVNLFSRKIEGFDRVLERYDEIILDKASKVDVFEIKEFLPKLLLSIDFEHFKEIDTKQKQVFDEKLSLAHTSVQEVEEQISKFNAAYKQFKNHFKDFMSKYSSIKDIEYQLDSKADKSDIYAMFDCTSRREEVKLVTQSMEVFHKQLEMSVIFQMVIVKTLLKTNDSGTIKIRQRNDAFSSLNSLFEWISQSIPPEVDKLLDSARMIFGNNSRKTPPDNESEHMLPLLANAKKYKRHAVSLTPAPDSKSFRNLVKD